MSAPLNHNQINQLKRKAKRLKTILGEKSLMQCQEILAKVEGFRSWHEISKNSNKQKVQNYRDYPEQNASKDHLYIGTSLDSHWKSGERVSLDLNFNPNVAVIGQASSSKTRTVCSLIKKYHSKNPGTIWHICEGITQNKEYETLADSLSPLPAVKPESQELEGRLDRFVNTLDQVWWHLKQRRALFQKQQCPSFLEYGRRTNGLPRIFLVIDEFSAYNYELDFSRSHQVAHSPANRLKRLLREGANYGIHFIFASRRFMDADIPVELRANFTAMLVHKLSPQDADNHNLDLATKLKSAEFFVKAAGLYEPSTGRTALKIKADYAGVE